MESSDRIRLKSVVLMTTLLAAAVMYVVLYKDSTIQTSKVLDGKAFKKTLSELKVERAKTQPERMAKNSKYSNRHPEKNDITLDRKSTVNITLANNSETFRKATGLPKDIAETKRPIEIQKWRLAINKNVSSAFKQNGRMRSFLTLFTTWSYNPQTLFIHNNTVNNWDSFYPTVTCIVFTNDSRIADAVLSKHWKVQKVRKFAVNGIPILKYMYLDAMGMFDSEFYAYANADILFTDGLISTLMMLRYRFLSSSVPIMITGQRWNVINASAEEVNQKKNLEDFVFDRGSLFHTWAADYFIYNREYRWNDMTDVIVGSLAFDNWLILQSRKSQHILIDATKTILAVHQSLDSDMYRSHKTNISAYNANLIASIYGPQPYHLGKVDCIENITTTENDRIVIQRRELPRNCILTP